MTHQHRRSRARLAIAVTIAVALPAAAHASSGGLPSTLFSTPGCNSCHTGGVAPTVLLNGPTTVDPGDTVDYTLTILSNDVGQDYGGLNVRASLGTLTTGGPFSAGTKTIAGAGGLNEITHSTPKQADLLNQIEYSFRWTAPANFSGSVTFTGWGNAVDRNFNTLNDRATVSTLVVSSSAPSPTPSPTPTPGPDYCANPSVPDPPAVSDPAALSCQGAVAKAASLYVKKSLKTVQKCLATLQASGTAAEPIGLCAGSTAAAIPAVDPKAAVALAKTESKTRSLIAAKCTDTAVAALGLCGATESALEDCLVDTLHQGVIDAVVSQYGAVAPSADKGEQKCQAAIASTAGGVINAYLKASTKCLSGWQKDGAPGAGGPLCVGDAVLGAFVAPTDDKVAGALLKATAKLNDKVTAACTDTQVAALDACGASRAAVIQCAVCAARGIDGGLIGAVFGDLN